MEPRVVAVSGCLDDVDLVLGSTDIHQQLRDVHQKLCHVDTVTPGLSLFLVGAIARTRCRGLGDVPGILVTSTTTSCSSSVRASQTSSNWEASRSTVSAFAAGQSACRMRGGLARLAGWWRSDVFVPVDTHNLDEELELRGVLLQTSNASVLCGHCRAKALDHHLQVRAVIRESTEQSSESTVR